MAMAMAMAMAGKQEKEFWRELRHKCGCCCFGWSVYASWAFYMGIYGHYTTPNCQYGCLLACLISRVIITITKTNLQLASSDHTGAVSHLHLPRAESCFFQITFPLRAARACACMCVREKKNRCA